MKISFLIPSKDRLGLATHAIESIRSQPCLDYEIVVVDNASTENYEDEIRKLKDSRIVFKRQEHSVSVTDNWSTSLALATGEYVLMLGDDDALAPWFASVANDYLRADQPDLIYLASYHYCYPGVIPGQEAGYLASVLNSEFLEPGAIDPFCLTHDYAVDLARDILKFRYRIGLNAQHYLLKRSFLRHFEGIGGFYQSPYPDTFSSIAALLCARSIVVLPRELVIIGISPKSFGAYYFSGRQEEGYLFLDNIRVTPKVRASLEPVILPGDKNDTNWLIAAEAVRQTFPDVLGDSVDAGRYRALQMIAVLRTSPTAAALEDLRSGLLPAERPLFAALEACVRSAGEGEARNRMFAAIATEIGQYYPARVSFIDIGKHSHVGDAIDFLRRLDEEWIGEPAPSHPTECVGAPTSDCRADVELKEIGETMRSRVKETFVRLFPSARKCPERQARLLEETAPPEAAKQSESEAQQVGSEKEAAEVARPWISVYRDGEVFALMVEDIDRFRFMNGDELSVEPAIQRDRWLRTPDGHVHVPVAPGVGVRVPPMISFFEFKGYSIPEHLIDLTGAGIASFDGIGRAHIANYERIMRLSPQMTFLEIGSGAGRDAFQLLDLLGSEGRYIGIDVQRESIAWCRNNIGKRHPNFQFHHFNAHHELHNPIATKTTLDFRLPVPDSSVDRVALGSVFTHIFADEVLHYLKDLARVMKPEGLCYATFFLYSEEVVQASRQNNVTQYNLRFEHPHGDRCYINDLHYPTGAVAFTEEKMNAMIKAAGLTLDRPFLKGAWSGYYSQGEAEDGQDVAVLRRT